jgi:copper(I)-binding protein
MRPLLALLVSVALLPAVEVADAFARATAPSQRTGAIFLRLSNPSATALDLTGASTTAAAKTELHTHLRDAEGVMRMRPVPAITIPAKGSATLKPGADHVMLFDLTGPLVEGKSLPLTLTFSDGSSVQVTVPIRNIAATSAEAPKPSCCDP